MVTIKYKELSDFTTAQTLQKIANTPTSGKSANLIRRVIKEVQVAREMISKGYQDTLVAKYAEKNEDGSIKRPDGEPNGFTPIETMMTEFMAEQNAFGERVAEIDCSAIPLSALADVKLSATELESLKGLYTDEETSNGPGLPQMGFPL